jgi:hypothetical protein
MTSGGRVITAEIRARLKKAADLGSPFSADIGKALLAALDDYEEQVTRLERAVRLSRTKDDEVHVVAQAIMVGALRALEPLHRPLEVSGKSDDDATPVVCFVCNEFHPCETLKLARAALSAAPEDAKVMVDELGEWRTGKRQIVAGADGIEEAVNLLTENALLRAQRVRLCSLLEHNVEFIANSPLEGAIDRAGEIERALRALAEGGK